MRADSVLLTDEDAMRRAKSLLTAQDLLEYANSFVEEGILIRRYMQTLKEEASRWLSRRM